MTTHPMTEWVWAQFPDLPPVPFARHIQPGGEEARCYGCTCREVPVRGYDLVTTEIDPACKWHGEVRR